MNTISAIVAWITAGSFVAALIFSILHFIQQLIEPWTKDGTDD